jgi:hypothetical protein
LNGVKPVPPLPVPQPGMTRIMDRMRMLVAAPGENAVPTGASVFGDGSSQSLELLDV